MHLHNFSVNMGDSGDGNNCPGSAFAGEACEQLEQWLAWFENGYDYFYDPPQEDQNTTLSESSVLSNGFTDNYSEVRVRLCHIMETQRFPRPFLGSS